MTTISPDSPALPGWYAVVGPAKMDPRVVEKLSAAVAGFLADPAVRAKLIEKRAVRAAQFQRSF